MTLKWVAKYNLAAVNILGPPAKVKCVWGKTEVWVVTINPLC